MLGGAMQRGTNSIWANVGKSVGSQSMVNSGAKGLAEGQYKRAISTLEGRAAAGNVKAKTRLDFLKGDAGKEAFINRKTAAAQNKFKIETPAPATSTTATTAATQAAFSEDTNAELKEAALIGTGLTLATGGVLLAKHGKLGKTAKGAYDSVSGKIRKIWKETTIKNGKKKVKKESSSFTTKSPGKPPKTNSVSEITTEAPGVPPVTTVTTKTSGKSTKTKRYPQEVWKRMINYCKSRGLNFRDKKNQEIALAAVTK
jgi:hypothetical protein